MSLLLIAGLGMGGLSLATYVRQRALKYSQEHSEFGKPEPQAGGPALIQAPAAEPPNAWAFVAKHFFKTASSPTGQSIDPPSFSEELVRPRRKRWRISPLNVTLFLIVLSVVVGLVPESEFPSQALRDFLTIVLMSATVGIGTNYIAIWMLFFPLKPLPVIRFQGIIPRKRNEIIQGLAAGIRQNLLDESTIQKAIHDSDVVRKAIDQLLEGMKVKIEDQEFRKDLIDLIRQSVHAFLSNEVFRSRMITSISQAAEKLPSRALGAWLPGAINSQLGKLLAEKVQEHRGAILNYVDHKLDQEIHSICDALMGKFQALPATVEAQREFLEGYITQKLCGYAARFDIEAIVREKMQSMDESEFYRMISDVTEHELANLQYLGAALGALAGLIMYIAL